MSGQDLSHELSSVASRIHEKFHLYFIALAFTLAGLAVETAEFNQGVIVHAFELLGWIGLAITGLVGMSRIRNVETQFALAAERSQRSKTIKDITAGAMRREVGMAVGPAGEALNPREAYDKMKVEYAVLGEMIEDEGKITGIKWRIQKFAFLSGLITLMLARGWPGIASIWRSITALI